MILIYNYSYINKAFGVTNRSFSREYFYLLHLFNYTDAWFYYKNQKIFVSVVGPSFFDGDECQAFHKLGTDTIIFNFIYKYDVSARGQYLSFQDPFKSYDICILPFSWYTRDAVFNTDSAFIRAINNTSYQIQSLGFTPLTWINERYEKSIYSNPLACIAYDSSKNLLPYKSRPNGSIQPSNFFQLSFPSVIDTLLLYIIQPPTNNPLTATITYGDDAWENTTTINLSNGLNSVYMFQDNPTNPRIYEVLPPGLMLRSTPVEPYYGYQLLPEFIQSSLIYNSDRTLTIQDTLIKQHYGFYRFSCLRFDVPLSIIFIQTTNSLVDFSILLYDNHKSCVYESTLVNFFTSANSSILGDTSNAYISGVSAIEPIDSTLTIQVTGRPMTYTFGLGNINNINGNQMLLCIDSLLDNGSSITFGNSVVNSNRFCFGLTNTGDINQYCSNLINNITSTTNETWNYVLYYLNSLLVLPSQLTFNSTVNYYYKQEFIRTSIRYLPQEFKVPTTVIIYIYSTDGINPPNPQPQHYGYYEKTFSASTIYTNKYFFYKPFIPFDTVKNESLILYNSLNNGALEYNKLNVTSWGNLIKYFFNNLWNCPIGDYYYRLSHTSNDITINAQTDRLYTVQSADEQTSLLQGIGIVGYGAAGVAHPSSMNYYSQQNIWTVLRIDSYTVAGNDLTIGAVGVSNHDWTTNGYWCMGLDVSAAGGYVFQPSLLFSNVHAKLWYNKRLAGFTAHIYFFEMNQMPITYSSTKTFYDSFILESFNEDPTGSKFYRRFDRPTKVLIIFTTTTNAKFTWYNFGFTNQLTFYSLTTPNRHFITEEQSTFYPTNSVGYRIQTAAGISPVASCIPSWTVWSLPSSSFFYTWTSYAYNMPSQHSQSFLLTSKSYKQTGIQNYVYFITYQTTSGGGWQFLPSTTGCDPTTWYQEGTFNNLTFASNNSILAWHVTISKLTKTITQLEILNDVEFYSFFNDNANNILSNNVDLSTLSNMNNIGNSLDGTLDFMNLPVALGAPYYNVASTVPTLNDWKVTEKIVLPITPNRLFCNKNWININPNSYNISTGLSPWDSFITLNNNNHLESAIYLDKSIPIDAIQFIFTSNDWNLNRNQSYEIMFYFNTWPLTSWTWSSYFSEGDTIVFGGFPTFDLITIQIRKKVGDITLLDLDQIELYYYLEGISFSIPYDLQTTNLLSIGNSIDTSVDLLNNPVSLGFPVNKIPNGNDHYGTWKLSIPNSQNCVLAINHNYPLYQNSTLIFETINDVVEISNYIPHLGLTSIYIPKFDQPASVSFTQNVSLDNDSFIQVNKVTHSDYYRHVWLGELYAVDPSTNFGTVDVSTGRKIFNYIDGFNENGFDVSLFGSSTYSSTIIMNMDDDVCDYVFYGSNIYQSINNIVVPVGLTYNIYSIDASTSNRIIATSTFTFYNKQVFTQGQTINISQYYSIIPSRTIIIISSSIGAIDLSTLVNDTIKVGCLPIKLFSNSNYIGIPNGYSCYKFNGQFGNTFGFYSQLDAASGIRINGFANSINNPNTSVPLGFLVQSSNVTLHGFINYKYCLFTNAIDSTLTNDFRYNAILNDGEGYFIMPDQFANNLIYIQLNNFANSFCQPEIVYQEFEILVGCFTDFDFPVAQVLPFTSQYNAINFGNSIDGLYQANGNTVQLNELILKPTNPPPPPGELGWVVGPVLIKGQNIEVNFSIPSVANNYYADVYISDPDDDLHYNIWATKIKLTADFIYDSYMFDTKQSLLRGIITQNNRNTAIINQPGNRINLPNLNANAVFFLRCAFSNPNELNTGCPQPPQLIIVPINRLYDYTITLSEPCLDIVFGAKQPYIGQPLLSEVDKQKFQYANKYAIGFDHENFITSPWSNSLARQVLFPSMTDFYNNYAYSISKLAKHVDSSRTTLVEQEWLDDSNYDIHPETSSLNVRVKLIDSNQYSANLTNLSNYYNLAINGINTFKPWCDYTNIMKDGIRIFKSYFDLDSYLSMENMLEKTMLIQRIDWQVFDSVIPLYKSQEFFFTSIPFPYVTKVGAYVPFIGEQTPNVTFTSVFNNWTSCVVLSDLVNYKRNKLQPLFIQNNKNRSIIFTKWNQNKQFTLYCTTTPQYLFLCFQ